MSVKADSASAKLSKISIVLYSEKLNIGQKEGFCIKMSNKYNIVSMTCMRYAKYEIKKDLL